MSPYETSSGFEAEGFNFSSSGSSDSEFFLDEDIQTDGNNINKEWEAIERTLYQEPGEQVTDPELLRECRLWRETFPHFRVKGTKIDVRKSEGGDEKSIQTLGNHFDMKKLKEKRESIKNKVVEELVERLIAKFSLNKGNEESGKTSQGTETRDTALVKYTGSSSCENTEKESYFERGKGDAKGVSKKEMETKLFQMLDSWEKDDEKLSSPETQNFNYFRLGTSSGSILKSSEKPGVRFKPEKQVFTTNFVAKPFEMTKKIDKKYEALLERIIERRGSDIEPHRVCRTTSSETEAKSYQQSLEKLRLGSGFEDYSRRHRNFPRLNKFSNNWLERGEVNYYRGAIEKAKVEEYKDNRIQHADERLIKQLKKEVLVYKRPAKKPGVTEEINLRRPKPFRFDEGTHKSSSCGNLPKSNKKNGRSKSVKGGGGEVGNSKSSGKLSSGKGSQSGLLPPIESGIICTELTGRPKIGPRNPPKRY